MGLTVGWTAVSSVRLCKLTIFAPRAAGLPLDLRLEVGVPALQRGDLVLVLGVQAEDAPAAP
jgi:hypothetical protein